MQQFALNYHDERVFIDDTISKEEYFCPCCGAPLITKKGEIYQHHFAHKSSHECTDSWAREYDISAWHFEWQNCFPKENREILLQMGKTKHRADVLTGRTVIEFQHSPMSVDSFNNRNAFYYNLGYKVIWLFDMTEQYDSGEIWLEGSVQDNQLMFHWNNPKKAFNAYDVKSGCIDLFFQMTQGETCTIVEVLDVGNDGFETFYTTVGIDKQEFLDYVGMKEGECQEPERFDIEKDSDYRAFIDRYGISLNKQQDRAVQAIEGAVLLLATPGSGKTTVLLTRLGYMMLQKGISPENILSITYTNSSANDMKSRLSEMFGNGLGKRTKIQTINALSYEIYLSFCKDKEINARCVMEIEQNKILREVIKKTNPECRYPSESDVLELKNVISYIKNQCLNDAEIREMEDCFPYLLSSYKAYEEDMKDKGLMDFDDQMVLAYAILRENPERLSELQKRYKYICVDEAQDTSKLQHKLIQLLVGENNNIFMVGDEDQSIYAFRGAYPKALLNFKTDYRNPYILKMETNYRSVPGIVNAASGFINRNTGRYVKNMIACRKEQGEIKKVQCKTREEQYDYLLEVAQKTKGNIAFLFRENDTAIPIKDMFLRDGIKFSCNKAKKNYLKTGVFAEIRAFLTLSLNEGIDDAWANNFKRIYSKCWTYLRQQSAYYAGVNSNKERKPVWETAQEQWRKYQHKYSVIESEFCKQLIQPLKDMSPTEAILHIAKMCACWYCDESNRYCSSIEILLYIAKKEKTVKSFLERLKVLERFEEGEAEFTNEKDLITLSTIHSSKGVEYDTVYIVDAYDGVLPTDKEDFFNRSKDDMCGYQEERRLFYVALTRAKTELYLLQIADRPTSFIDEVIC